jgi:dihydropteroate synthase
MVAEGADLIDIGGESTRPGAAPVTVAEELRRVLPVIEALSARGVLVSVDSRHNAVIAAALQAGARIVNDVSALQGDGGSLAAVAASGAAVVLMHMQGEPRTMQQAPAYRDVVGEIRSFLAERVVACKAAGVARERLLLDPGFGFGKTLAHNLTLMRELEQVRVDGLPLLVGLSRKRMIGTITGRAVSQRTAGSVAAALLAVERGADIVRVHDVAETADALRMLAALLDPDFRADIME